MTPCSFSNAQISTTPVNHGNPQISDAILKHTNKTQHEYQTHNTIQLKLTIPTQISIKWTKKTQKTKRHCRRREGTRRETEGGRLLGFAGVGTGRGGRDLGADRGHGWQEQSGPGETKMAMQGVFVPFKGESLDLSVIVITSFRDLYSKKVISFF